MRERRSARFLRPSLPEVLWFTLFATFFGASRPNPLHAQTPAEITAAQQLQEAGDFAAAADALRPYLQRFPDDTGTRWLFGRLLFWAGNHREARRAYEAVLARTPDDPWLKLEYAPVLMALGEWGKARGVLRGVLATGSTEGRTGGPPDTAAITEAERQLSEIQFLTRPWANFNLGLLDDNQPYRRYQGGLEGGVFLTPLWSLSAGGDPRLLDGYAR
ncbi:MAG: tetratricopeptide repeat protein, partial [Longimicrobiales bacterium]|nr:tetratricopeptide repeat protein [Longimicrobiales bacterium]